MQQMRDGPDFSDHILHDTFAIGERSHGLGQLLDVSTHGGKIHAQGGQHLADTIVQFAGDAPPLIILQLQQAG